MTQNHTPAMDQPIVMAAPENVDFLRGLQGNILRQHGRKFASHIFVRFLPTAADAARKWVSKFGDDYVTNAYEQYQAEMSPASTSPSDVFGHISLSASGYRALGFDENSLPHGLNPRNRPDGSGYVEAFRHGQKSRQVDLHDPTPDAWQERYRNDLHMLVILAADNEDALSLAEVAVSESLKDVVEAMFQERGMVLQRQFDPNDAKSVGNVEHFGYVDGISLPRMTQEEIDFQKNKNGGIDDYDPSAPLNLVLAPDGLGGDNNFGSFLVYRKLEQNVRGFNEGVSRLATALGITDDLARAFIMGRFQDGTPVVKHGTGSGRSDENNFDYDDDWKGMRCPFHAHTRKANPRRDGTINDHHHRIARRAIPYGGDLTTSTKLEDMPTSGVGLLFICFQADIFEQFEFIQRVWANFKNFPHPGNGVDPVVGQPTSPGATNELGTSWPAGWDQSPKNFGVSLAGYVKLMGGEYFFSPSVSFLKSLATKS